MNWVIYTLKSPRTGGVRYVGWTARTPEQRLNAHISVAINRPASHKDNWILSLLAVGLQPVIEVIESGTGQGWREAERRWIAEYRTRGALLVNGTDGGDGTLGRVHTSEQRARLSEGKRAAWATRTPAERN